MAVTHSLSKGQDRGLFAQAKAGFYNCAPNCRMKTSGPAGPQEVNENIPVHWPFNAFPKITSS
jgi:hypothetical protein